MREQQPKKRLGQHFLHAPGIIDRIIAAIAARPDEHLVEIGPGRGAITLPLLACGPTLDVIEFDRDLITDLQALANTTNGRLRVHHEDALAADLCAIAGEEKLRVVGNLPYNISTPLLFRLIEQRACIQDMHFMLQKEVVERMVCPPGSREYGRLSVMVQYHCEAQRLFTIGPGAFNPPPKVESAFVRLIPRAHPPFAHTVDERTFADVVRMAFSQRRKTLRNAMKSWLEKDDFTDAGIDPGLRAEQLGLEEFARLTLAAKRRKPTSD
ncbi:MAG: 16S rRNA (adenine(1518)-N(6)/adenine(1519)-N(6))-dimethyltransferase RsmA [Chromatiales bacterium]|jgi:16S rRNA (adenine1518-N6/adenine1519-N6)-dimethyltransferase|nr:16S rRNA (adenine(1518)-N(6)/adenine(1519)-N(6))-dimethyltransferase RsmA [Chromatiales bacterium]